MAMNIKKVVIGGLVAGVILNAVDFATNTFILGARVKAETEAFKPGLSDQMMNGSAITSYVSRPFSMGKLFSFLVATILGYVVWFIGAKIGITTAFVLSMVGTGVGMYYGRLIARNYGA